MSHSYSELLRLYIKEMSPNDFCQVLCAILCRTNDSGRQNHFRHKVILHQLLPIKATDNLPARDKKHP